MINIKLCCRIDRKIIKFFPIQRELAQAINKKMEEKLKKDKKITKLNILKFITSVNEFGETAFGKNNLNFDEYELTK